MSMHSLGVNPDRGLKGFRRVPVIENRHHRGESMRCRKREVSTGDMLLCSGWIRSDTRVVGRFNVPGAERCDTKTRFRMSGGADCDPGALCPDVRSGDILVGRRPSGC